MAGWRTGLPKLGPATSLASGGTALTASCTDCHAMDPGLSHPVGVVPSMQIPEPFVLDHGKMTCTTCHEPREHAAGGMGAMLRPGLSELGLCSQCHTTATRASPHVGDWGRAHLVGAEVGVSSALAHATRGTETRECMSCHDGSVATDAGNHRIAGRSELGSEDDHPVEIAYGAGLLKRGSESMLKPAARLDHRIRLFGSYMGCGSCHSTYSRHKDLLVIPNTGSQLCLNCHQV
ncbi:MAG: hypothetical protein L6Q35_11760 [Phycisphaerales bacterium]|nr:hypothetical protein [Phycisphaerales bacterium]